MIDKEIDKTKLGMGLERAKKQDLDKLISHHISKVLDIGGWENSYQKAVTKMLISVGLKIEEDEDKLISRIKNRNKVDDVDISSCHRCGMLLGVVQIKGKNKFLCNRCDTLISNVSLLNRIKKKEEISEDRVVRNLTVGINFNIVLPRLDIINTDEKTMEEKEVEEVLYSLLSLNAVPLLIENDEELALL